MGIDLVPVIATIGTHRFPADSVEAALANAGGRARHGRGGAERQGVACADDRLAQHPFAAGAVGYLHQVGVCQDHRAAKIRAGGCGHCWGWGRRGWCSRGLGGRSRRGFCRYGGRRCWLCRRGGGFGNCRGLCRGRCRGRCLLRCRCRRRFQCSRRRGGNGRCSSQCHQPQVAGIARAAGVKLAVAIDCLPTHLGGRAVLGKHERQLAQQARQQFLVIPVWAADGQVDLGFAPGAGIARHFDLDVVFLGIGQLMGERLRYQTTSADHSQRERVLFHGVLRSVPRCRWLVCRRCSALVRSCRFAPSG